MKLLFLMISLILLNACQQNQSPPIVESSTEKSLEKIQKSQISLESLTDEQKKKLDANLPPEVREIFDKAEQLEIYVVNLDEDTKKQQDISSEPTNKVAKITDSSLKKIILDNFYFDVAEGGAEGKLCWSPRHRLIAKHQGKTVDILICFECDNYRGSSSFGEIYGVLGTNKSMPLIDKAIEKYGIDEVLPIEWKENLDRFISPKNQEIFENAEKIVITTKTMAQNSDKAKTKKAIVSEQSEKRALLDFIYKSASKNLEFIDCKGFFQNTIEAEYKGKKAKIEFELSCGYLLADGQALTDKNEFAKIISNFVEKYGVDVQ